MGIFDLFIAFLGWIVILIAFYIMYFVLYAWEVSNPIDEYLGFSNETMDEYLARRKDKSYLSDRLYLDYWDQLPFYINYVLVVLNLAFIAMVITLSIIYFTHMNLNPFLFTFLGIQIACVIYIHFATVRLDEKDK